MRTALALFALLVCGAAVAQVNASDPHKINATIEQLEELDLANRILPLLMTKDQIRKLLPEIEKCRSNVRAQEKKEADRIRPLQPEIDKYSKEVLEGKMPPTEFTDKVSEMFEKFQNERLQVKVANALVLTEAMGKHLNEGQLRAAIGVVDKVYDDAKRTWVGGNETAKLQFYAVTIFLSDRAYDLLVKLAK